MLKVPSTQGITRKEHGKGHSKLLNVQKLYPAQEMPQSQKAEGWVSTRGKHHKNLVYVMLCHLLFGDSRREKKIIQTFQYGCSSALKLKACISVTVPIVRESGKKIKKAEALQLKEFFNTMNIVVVRYYSPNPEILEVEGGFLREECFKTHRNLFFDEGWCTSTACCSRRLWRPAASKRQ